MVNRELDSVIARIKIVCDARYCTRSFSFVCFFLYLQYYIRNSRKSRITRPSMISHWVISPGHSDIALGSTWSCRVVADRRQETAEYDCFFLVYHFMCIWYHFSANLHITTSPARIQKWDAHPVGKSSVNLQTSWIEVNASLLSSYRA